MKISLPYPFKDRTKNDKNKILKETERHKIGAAKIERKNISRILMISIIAIIIICVVISILLQIFDKDGGAGDLYTHLRNVVDNIIALLFVVVILDNMVTFNNENRRQRDERRSIIRHNRIIQPVVDMYIVRKNMVITPNEKTVRKFQINAKFTIQDMKDMYGPSELISDVGKSKIEMYCFYQTKLHEDFIHLVENVDFTFYPDLCDAAMKYINATSYGSAALKAVVSYQDARAGTKSMRAMVIGMIREEPANRRFVDAPPAMKNVYLVHQTINDQEIALGEYLKIIQGILAEEPKIKKPSDLDYE
ncbi:MAG: hypothetical protein RBR05_01835 [Candidatus Methanomethylophilaceae archaeon]|nr:hypothetical protein [Candidatus Methanomethylophilaceae archaeon]MDD3378590.1 hypothetical protein [Candidatus Methanomethylophilaceae archaeon]MDY0224125.1 hypothetical protein [Candidatus Methanomethylophilaceae archaeon]